MITEDYVSFEVAKLLKENGFDSECDYLYADGELIRARGGACNWNSGETLFAEYKNECSAPTLQMAMKWLRDVHKIHIIVIPISFEDGIFWGYKIVQLCSNNDCLELHRSSVNVGFDTYEEAAEAAIKHCLENLI